MNNKNISKLHFISLPWQTVCFKELLNQQKIRVKVKYLRKIDDDVIALQYSLLHAFLYKKSLAQTARSSTLT